MMVRNYSGLATITAIFFALTIGLTGCEEEKPISGGTSKPIPQKERVETPTFSADSAYAHIQTQVDFGPRVPGYDAHTACGDWLVQKLKDYGADVIEQRAQVIAYDGTPLPMRNIIGQFQPEKKKRIMLYAHWDTRPYADKDSVRTKQPIDGANDGGSGVGVLLEVARLIQAQPTNYGIDIVFFDTEDYGKPEWLPADQDITDWCLGSQYWAENKHKPGYRAKFGILLDMVGAKDAVFHKEGTSMELAPDIVSKVWKAADQLGHGNFFKKQATPPTVDDNYFVNFQGGIPSANIVHYHLSGGVRPMGYGFFHHTHQDNMEIIDTATLQAVGETVIEVIYQE
ncbi:MAG: M28 family peptidase [Flavobacteriales bacterium]|nr:M28 family peptidase [Flavobacteriales bacterium]